MTDLETLGGTAPVRTDGPVLHARDIGKTYRTGLWPRRRTNQVLRGASLQLQPGEVGFLLPFLDVGLAQNVMFDAAPPSWASFMPGYGAVRVLVDGAFTPSFDETAGLLFALVWVVAITGAAAAVFHRLAAPRT